MKNERISTIINKMREKNHRVLKGLYTKKRMDFYIGRNSQLDDIEDYLGIEKDETWFNKKNIQRVANL